MTPGPARKAARVLALGAALTLAACSTPRPWLNLPVGAQSSPALPGQAPSLVVAVALSGGGARSSAFGLGVLRELKATQFEWQGRSTSVLDEVGLVSAVSGASVLAAYYAAFGDDTFTRFERDFLMADFQPATTPTYGHSNALDEKLERLYRGATFADLPARRGGPRLLVTATDLATGAPFEFTPQQFALIRSDLGSVPLSVAVTASSAVPPLLSPVTLKNYATDAQIRPFLHLVDGGLVDKLGVRGVMARAVAGGFAEGSVRKFVLISVSSECDTAWRTDRNDQVPAPLQVLGALGFGAGSRATQEAIAAMKDSARRKLNAARGTQGSPFAADAQIHVISVSLRDLIDEKARDVLLQIPTALPISPIQVRQLEEAGRAVLRQSPEFQQLRDGLKPFPVP